MDWGQLIANLIALITKALPDDELKREQFKLRYPKRYQQIYNQKVKKAVRELRWLGVKKPLNEAGLEVVKAYVRGVKMDQDFEAVVIYKLNQ